MTSATYNTTYGSNSGPDESLGMDIVGNNLLVKLFPSPTAYADYLERIPRSVWYANDKLPHQWYDGKDPSKTIIDTIRGLREGDSRAADMAEKIVNQLQDQQIFADGAPQPDTQIVGGFTVTQLYDQGIPTCMLAYDTSDFEGVNTPLTVYFDAYGSIGLKPELATARGVACLAFVMALAQVRPVEMYVITCSSPREYGLYGALVKVPTNPLDLKRVGFMLTDYYGYISNARWTAMSWSYIRRQRMSGYNYVQETYSRPIGPFGGSYSEEKIKGAYKRALKAKPDDIVLYGTQTTAPRIHNIDAALDPVGWVKAMLDIHRSKKHSGELEEELKKEQIELQNRWHDDNGW